MITIVSQPNAWVSAYDQVAFAIQDRIEFGTSVFAILAGDDSVSKKVDADGVLAIPEGDLVEIDGNLYSVIGASGEYLVISDPDDVLAATGYTGPFYQLTRTKKIFKLLTGYKKGNTFANDYPLTKFVDIKCVADATGTYNIRIDGYLQEAFEEISVPTIGPDRNLFIHYLLKYYLDFDNNITYDIGVIKNAANGCVDDINSTTYVTANAPLMATRNFNTNSTPGIESYIIGDQIKNRELSTAIAAKTDLEKATDELRWMVELITGVFEEIDCDF